MSTNANSLTLSHASRPIQDHMAASRRGFEDGALDVFWAGMAVATAATVGALAGKSTAPAPRPGR